MAFPTPEGTTYPVVALAGGTSVVEDVRITLLSPTGLRIEGVAIADAIAILRGLS